MELVTVAEATAVGMVVVSSFLAARKSLWSPIIGIASVVPWLVFAYLNGAWFLVGMEFALTALSIRTYICWKGDLSDGHPNQVSFKSHRQHLSAI
jgi:hypothetical protein